MKSLLLPKKVLFEGIMNPSPLEKLNCGLGSNVRLFFLSYFVYSQYQNKYIDPACESKPTTQACLLTVGRVIIWIKFSQNQTFNINFSGRRSDGFGVFLLFLQI